MQFLETLSQTPLVLWVAQSDYGYPSILTLHALGMALVVGVILIIDLRVLGVARVIPLASLQRYFLVVWIGLAINLCSGSLLFAANYSAFIKNTAFITKILMLLTAGVGTFLLAKELRISALLTTDGSADVASGKARLIAFVCVLLWLGAITAGRIVGYTAVPE